MGFGGALLVPGFGKNLTYADKLLALFGSSIVGYWPQDDASGTASRDIGGRSHNGVYTGVTLGQTGIGDGRTAASFDGATSYNNVYSAGLNTDFNNQEGTLAIWGKVNSAGVWTDNAWRTLAEFAANTSSNLIRIYKWTDNKLYFDYAGSATTKEISLTVTPTGFFHVAITWSKSGDQIKAYYAGAQTGSTLTSVPVWSGALLSTSSLVGGGSTVPVTAWSGLLAHALLLNRAASAAEILTAATVP